MVSSGSAKVKTEKPWNPEDDNLGKTFKCLNNTCLLVIRNYNKYGLKLTFATPANSYWLEKIYWWQFFLPASETLCIISFKKYIYYYLYYYYI